MGVCIAECSPAFAAKHKVHLCSTETYLDMAKAAGFQVVSSELVHSQGRFPGKDRTYNREFIFIVLKKAWKKWLSWSYPFGLKKKRAGVCWSTASIIAVPPGGRTAGNSPGGQHLRTPAATGWCRPLFCIGETMVNMIVNGFNKVCLLRNISCPTFNGFFPMGLGSWLGERHIPILAYVPDI